MLLLLAAALPASAAPGEKPIIAWTYTVRPGDTFQSIARRMGVTIKELAAANRVAYPWPVKVGQVLKRPDPPGAPIAVPPATLTLEPAPGAAPKARPAARPTARPAPPPRPLPSPRPVPEPLPAHAREPGAPQLAWPTSGAVVGRFGVPVKGKANRGMDLATFAGMTVRAAAAGKVIFAGEEPERFGQLIVIDHGNGWTTAYGYLGKLAVSDGQQVTARQVIARIGRSGEAATPTLHFEVRKDNVPRDPYAYLPVRL